MSIVPSSTTRFDTIKRIRPDDTEMWSARDLMLLMSYRACQDFKPRYRAGHGFRRRPG